MIFTLSCSFACYFLLCFFSCIFSSFLALIPSLVSPLYVRLFADHDFRLPFCLALTCWQQLNFIYLPSVFTFSWIEIARQARASMVSKGGVVFLRPCLFGVWTWCNEEAMRSIDLPRSSSRPRVAMYLFLSASSFANKYWMRTRTTTTHSAIHKINTLLFQRLYKIQPFRRCWSKINANTPIVILAKEKLSSTEEKESTCCFLLSFHWLTEQVHRLI